MRPRWVILVVAVIVVAMPAGIALSRARGQHGALTPEIKLLLEREAGRQAFSNGGEVPRTADVVLTSRQRAMDLFGGDTVDPDEPVYFVQMSGHFVSTGPHPPGVGAPADRRWCSRSTPRMDGSLMSA